MSSEILTVQEKFPELCEFEFALPYTCLIFSQLSRDGGNVP